MKKVYMLMAAAVMALTASAELNSAKTLDASVAPVEFEVTTATVNPFELKASSEDFSVKSLRSATELTIKQAPNKANANQLPIGDWMDKGTVEFTDDFLTTILDVTNFTCEVAIEESFSTPGLYRLVDPYKALAEANGFAYTSPSYMVIHAEDANAVYIETSSTGMVLPNYGEMIVGSLAGLYLSQGESLETLAGEGLCGTYKNGTIKFPVETLVVTAANLPSFYIANTNGAFKVKFPGAMDYDISVATTECSVDGQITIGIEAGEDVASVMYYVGPGAFGFNEANYNAAIQYGQVAEQAVFGLGFPEDAPTGRYTVLVAALDAEGNLVNGAGAYFYHVVDNPDEWVSHGEGVFGEDLFIGLGYQNAVASTMPAEIQEHKDMPGYFRVVNPFASMNEDNAHPTDHNHFIFVNAVDPNAVVIEESITGFDKGYGPIIMMSLPAVNEQLATPENFGKMTEKDEDTYLISFPVKTVVAAELYYQNAALFYVNTTGGLFFEIPKAKSGVENVAVDNVKAEYFNLQGVRVAEPSNGIFIRREGSKVSKVMM